jgi:hypothetical protein
MANIRRNPDHQPVTVDSIADDDAVRGRIDELLERALELECARDDWDLDEGEVVELADIRTRLADYAIAKTIERFGLDF